MKRLLMSLLLLSVVAGGTLAVASTTPKQPAAFVVATSPCNGNTCTLTAHLAGDGNGAVNSSDGMIICLQDGAPGCSASEQKGSKPSLTARPGPGSVFSCWGGDCSGTNATAPLTMDSSKDCTAVF